MFAIIARTLFEILSESYVLINCGCFKNIKFFSNMEISEHLKRVEKLGDVKDKHPCPDFGGQNVTARVRIMINFNIY